MDLEVIKQLKKSSDTKIVMLVMDGLGGLPGEGGIATELEIASTPHLDALAASSICGLHQPIGPGITPGSGPAHLALFGYDPLHYRVGRGVLAALGIDFDLQKEDIAARGNFCTLDKSERVVDRRAGRIPTKKCAQLCEELRKIEIPGIEIFIEPIRDYRFLLVLRGAGLSSAVEDTDPQKTGMKPLPPKPLSPEAEKTANLTAQFIGNAQKLLEGHSPANMILLRGFSKQPAWPKMEEIFGLRAAAIAAYPMYRGVAKLVGMSALELAEDMNDIFHMLEARWNDFDFFFLHLKWTDSAGEDGDFRRKVRLIEEVDSRIPRMLALKPDVVVVTGDHSTPARMKSHSWHSVPVLLSSPYCRPDGVDRFGERACMSGVLGPRFPAKDLMPLILANALRLEKFGA